MHTLLLLGRYSICTTVPRCSPDVFTVTLHTCSRTRVGLRCMMQIGCCAGWETYRCWQQYIDLAMQCCCLEGACLGTDIGRRIIDCTLAA